MGQARDRGTYEERKAASIALAEKKRQVVERKNVVAVISPERELKAKMILAQLAAIAHGGKTVALTRKK